MLLIYHVAEVSEKDGDCGANSYQNSFQVQQIYDEDRSNQSLGILFLQYSLGSYHRISIEFLFQLFRSHHHLLISHFLLSLPRILLLVIKTLIITSCIKKQKSQVFCM